MKGVVYTEIKVIDGSFSVCKVTDFSEVDPSKKFNFISATDEENSLICLTENVPDNFTERIDGWRALKIQGVLDFSLIEILSKILGLLAEAKIGIAAVSTYNTDYIFVKETDLDKAVETLAEANHKIIRKGGAE
jgi:hypothetical protein